MNPMQPQTSLPQRPLRLQPRRGVMSPPSASPNFMELMAQVGKDLAALSQQQQQAQSHDGQVMQLQGVP